MAFFFHRSCFKVFFILFLSSVEGLSSELKVDEEAEIEVASLTTEDLKRLHIEDQNRRHKYGLDILYQDWQWDIKSAQRGHRFYAIISDVCAISGVALGGATTILAAVAASQSGPEEGQDGRGWSIAATITGAASTVFVSFSKAAHSAAEKRGLKTQEIIREGTTVIPFEKANSNEGAAASS